MAFNLKKAKEAGYSDTEIADYLGSQSKFNTIKAREAGYDDAEIITHLSSLNKPKETGVIDSIKKGVGYITGNQTPGNEQFKVTALNKPTASSIFDSSATGAQASNRLMDSNNQTPYVKQTDLRAQPKPEILKDIDLTKSTPELKYNPDGVVKPIEGEEATVGNVVTGLAKSLPQGLEAAKQGVRQQFADTIGSEEMSADAQDKFTQGNFEKELSTPEIKSPLFKAAYGGLESTLRMLPSLGVSIAAKSPVPTLAAMGLQTEAESYSKYKERGASGIEAITGALGEGAVEVVTEIVPMSFLVNKFGKETSFKLIKGLIGREVLPEQAATLAQDAIDTAIANPDKTWGDYLAERPSAAFNTLIATVVQAGVMGGANYGVNKLSSEQDLSQRKIEKFKQLPNQNLERLLKTAKVAMPADVELIQAEIDSRAEKPTLTRAAEEAQRVNEQVATEQQLQDDALLQEVEQATNQSEVENVSDTEQGISTVLDPTAIGAEFDNGVGSATSSIPVDATGELSRNDNTIEQSPIEHSDVSDQPMGDTIAESELDSRSADTDEAVSVISDNDVTANDAATSPLNDLPEPTQAQKAAGNYKVGRAKVSGLDISIENPDGSTRRGVDRDGKSWSRTMNGNYGYVKGVVARAPDKEHVDVNVKPNTTQDYDGDVFIVNQSHPDTGKFDEPKVYVGYSSKEEAETAYRSNYADDWQGMDSIAQVPMAKFKEMLNDKKAFLKPIQETPTKTVKASKPKNPTTLLTTIFNNGGLSSSEKLDVTDQDKSFAPGGYNKVFNKQSKQSLKGMIESGTLDDYFPYNMRLENAGANDAFDSTEAYDYLTDKIRNGDRVLPYEVQEQLDAMGYEGDAVADVANTLTEDEINEELRSAGYEERESETNARDFDTRSESDGVVSSQGNETTKPIQKNEVTGSTNEQVRPIVETIVKRRAAANEIGKGKQFDNFLKSAKDLLNGETVKPSRFLQAAKVFAKDEVLANAYNQLKELAKPSAKSASTEKVNTVDTYKGIIDNAKSIAELQSIAKDIQSETSLSDAQVTELDDLVMDKMDSLEGAQNENDISDEDATQQKTEPVQKYEEGKSTEKNNRVGESDSEGKTSDKPNVSNDSSWVIINKETAEPVFETFQKSVANKINTKKYKAIPISEYLPALNNDLDKNNQRKPVESNEELLANIRKNLLKDEPKDLLGDNTQAKQAVADAERDKDTKRNSGVSDTEGFTLTGSNSEVDKAIAMGAQDLFGDANKKVESKAEEKPSQEKTKEPKTSQPATPLTLFDNAMDEYSKGIANVDDYKEAFDYVLNNETEIVDYLESNFTKQQLFNRGGRALEGRYKSEKKSRVVRALYSDMVSDFLLPSESGMTSYSYGFGEERYKGIKSQIDAITQESLDKAMSRLQKVKEENTAKVVERLKGIENPQTIEDYQNYLRTKIDEGMSYKDARMTLSLEQRVAYDNMLADKTRSERSSKKESQKTQVQATVTTTTGDIVETKHTKTGEPLFVVKTAERVDREIYNQWNATAKRMGGYYSSFRGSGAVPGFQFKTLENAEAFLKYLGGDVDSAKETIQNKRNAYADDRSQTAVERLTEMANKLEEDADADLNRDRKTNTSRRAGMAARAEANANANKAMAITMRKIAQAIESGDAKFLDDVRQKTQIELLNTLASNAQYKQGMDKYKTYSEYEKHKYDPMDNETADYADFPSYTLYRSDWARLGRALSEIDGFKKLGSNILSVADDVTDDYIKFAKDNLDKVGRFVGSNGFPATFTSKSNAERSIAVSGYNGKAIALQVKRSEYQIIDSPQAAKEKGVWNSDDKRITFKASFINEVVEKIGKANRRNNKLDMPWQLEGTYDNLKKLSRMGIENAAEMRAALREFIGLKENIEPPSKIKELERSMIGRRNDGLDFFPTPANTADTMIEAAGIEDGMSVLEPSAGMGHIAERIRESGVEPSVIELSGDRRELLEAKGFNVVDTDFTEHSEKYDRIIMNPPFSDRRDMAHVAHAYNLLKPNGRVVAIMGEGVFFGSDKKATAFREWLDKVGGTSEQLEEGTFNDPSLPVNTSVNARMVVIDKTDDGNVVMFSRDNKPNKTFTDVLDEIKQLGVKVNASEKDGDIFLSRIEVDTANRSQGKGTSAMQILVDYADETNQYIKLTAASDFGGSKVRLNEFYKRFGFVENKGKNKLFTISESMYRVPINNSDIRFSRGNQSTGLSVENVQSIVDELGAKWKNAPPINVVGSMQDSIIPERVRREDERLKANGSTGEPIAFITGGQVYILAPQVKNKAAVQEALFHEALGHFGLTGVYGSELNRILDQIVMMRKNDVIKKAKEYGLKLTDKKDLRKAAEEVLAEMAQTNPKAGYVQRAIAAIRKFLKSLGFDLKLSDNDIIVNYLLPARNYVKNGGKEQSLQTRLQPAYSLSENTKANYENRIDELFNGGKAKFNNLGAKVLDRSDMLDLLGYGDKPVYLAESKVIKGISTHPKITKEHWKKVPEWLENPAMVFDSDTNTGRLVFLPDELIDGNPIVLIVDPDANTNGLKVNLLINNYNKDRSPIKLWVNRGLLRYFDKWKSPKLLARSGLQLSSLAQAQRARNQTIYKKQDLVKYRAENDTSFSRSSNTDIPEETKIEAGQRVIQDKFNRFKVLSNWLKEQGTNLSEAADVYLHETLMSGRISTRKEDFREDVVKPLIEKTQKANITMEQIGDYLKAQHAPEANKRSREIHGRDDATAYGVTDEEAKQAIDEFKKLDNFDELKVIANEWRSITDKTKQIKIDAGLLDTEMAKAWESTYSMYVPVKGGDDNQKTGLGKGLHVNANNKRRLGHEKRDEAIIENILRDHEAAITLDEKNRVGKALIKFALEVGNEDIITVDKPVKRQVLKPGETAYVVQHKEMDIASFADKQTATLFIQAQAALGATKSNFAIVPTKDAARVALQASPLLADNEVNVYVKGHAIRIQINDEVAARQYKNMGIEHLNSILSASREVNSWLSKAYTGYSPDFIFTNPVRDATQGLITLTGNYGGLTAAKVFSNYPVAVKELVKHFKNRNSSELVNAYRNAGGSTGAAYMSDLERIGNDIQKSYDEYQGAIATYKNVYDRAIADGKSKKIAHAKASLRSGIAGFKKIPIIGHFMKMMESINAVTENALRVATYKALKDGGMSNAKAAAQAKNLMNFNRKGEQSNVAGSLYLFFNPSIQGTKLMQEALFTSPHKNQARALAGMMTLGAMAISALAMMGDDEDKKKWESTPDYVKDSNVLINAFGVQVKIPLPYGYKLFWTLGNVISDAMNGKDIRKLSIRMASSVFENLSPLGNLVGEREGDLNLFQILPTVPKMALGATEVVNQDGFGGNITPTKWNDATPDSQLMFRGTHGSIYDNIASKLNSATGGNDYKSGLIDVSPETMKYWVKSLLGGTGQFFGDSLNIGKGVLDGVPPQDVKDVPVIRRFIREPSVSDVRSAFWDRKNEADNAAKQFSLAKKARDVDAMQEMLDKNITMISLSKMSNKVVKLANASRDAVVAIKQDESLSMREKLNQIKELEKEEQEVYDLFINQFDSQTKQ